MADSTATATRPEPEPERPAGAPSSAPAPPARWTGGRIAAIVAGSTLALVAIVAIVLGAYGLWLHTTQRADGYVMTSSERFSTGGYALATRTLRITSDVPDFLYGRHWLGHVRIRGRSANPARPLFIGIARADDVDRYLAGVAHAQVTDVSANPFGTPYRPSYRTRTGGAPPRPPGRAGFWAASVAGRGTQALVWSVKQGRWAVVVMRPDGSRAVSADLAAGAKLPALGWASTALLVLGLITLASAAALVYLGARDRPGPAPSAAQRPDHGTDELSPPGQTSRRAAG